MPTRSRPNRSSGLAGTAPLVATGLVGGYAAARHAGRSDLATVVFTGSGAVCASSWLRSSGGRVTAVLLGTYLLAFWVSHPLAKRIGGWPSVLAVTTVAAAAAAGLADRPASIADRPPPERQLGLAAAR